MHTTALPNHAQPTAALSFQRRCACGSVVGPAGDCAACRAKRNSTPAPSSHVLPTLDGGQALESGVRVPMERAFGHSFSGVRVHAGPAAAAAARSVGASAYTVGRSIVFGDGAYAPASGDGRRLLAHELAHVVQQSRAGDVSAGASVPIGGEGFEAEAERASARVANGGHATPTGRTSAPALQRQKIVSDPATGVPVFEGIQAYHLVEQLPHAACSGMKPIRAGGYILGPNQVRTPADETCGGCTGQVVFYIAYSLSGKRNEWVVGPGSAAAFTANVEHFELVGHFTYQWVQPGAQLPAYQVESVRAVNKGMEGDIGGYFSTLGGAWNEARKDEGWLLSAALATIAPFTGGSGAAAAPRGGPPTLRVIPGGGGGTAGAIGRGAGRTVASGGPSLATRGSLALKAQPAPVPVTPPVPVRPPLTLVPPAALGPVTVSPGAVAAVGVGVATALGPSTGANPAPGPQSLPDETENRRRRGCSTLFPRATPIHWPTALWQHGGIGDPGSQDPAFDLPLSPVLVKRGSTLYNPDRPEVTRYRTRIENAPFRLQVPAGWAIHHKWPLYVGGPGDIEQAEGEYDAEGRTLASPNLVVMSPSDHAVWHRALVQQPRGPMFGQGPSDQTPDGAQFCVLELMAPDR